MITFPVALSSWKFDAAGKVIGRNGEDYYCPHETL